ncbi:hypothetical protein NDU88_002535 [Pleurodeles waltl]|uniref:Uncharacterized protein n=1 Tax=Pleurodeles waltl TaxID=8319 RepID=A0AAV7W3J8_PLEWA|nr:hypothetical protein NDU88_002535 [Pleurodeles waltl]
MLAPMDILTSAPDTHSLLLQKRASLQRIASKIDDLKGLLNKLEAYLRKQETHTTDAEQCLSSLEMNQATLTASCQKLRTG